MQYSRLSWEMQLPCVCILLSMSSFQTIFYKFGPIFIHTISK